MEYKWTKVEINVTIQHIVVLKLSNKNPQSTFKTSESSQVNNFKYTHEFKSPTS